MQIIEILSMKSGMKNVVKQIALSLLDIYRHQCENTILLPTMLILYGRVLRLLEHVQSHKICLSLLCLGRHHGQISCSLTLCATSRSSMGVKLEERV